jgi:hypothetical protein
VDHVVAYSLWQTKIAEAREEFESKATGDKGSNLDELIPRVNEIGNCMLLEKNFNISKSSRTLGEFLAEVYEFKLDSSLIDGWAQALELPMTQVECRKTSLKDLDEGFKKRTASIRATLEQFVRGSLTRVDLEE